MVVQRFARFQSNLGNLRISQDICYVRMTGNNDFLTIYGHRVNLLNNKACYQAWHSNRGHGFFLSEHNVVKNTIWREADQLAIYKA